MAWKIKGCFNIGTALFSQDNEVWWEFAGCVHYVSTTYRTNCTPHKVYKTHSSLIRRRDIRIGSGLFYLSIVQFLKLNNILVQIWEDPENTKDFWTKMWCKLLCLSLHRRLVGLGQTTETRKLVSSWPIFSAFFLYSGFPTTHIKIPLLRFKGIRRISPCPQDCYSAPLKN